MKELWRQVPVSGRSLAQRLCTAAKHRTGDPKALDLYGAALEVESVEQDPRMMSDIVEMVGARWAGVKGDQRTLEDAKRRLLKRLGAALRSVSGKIDTTPLYYQLFRIGTEEPLLLGSAGRGAGDRQRRQRRRSR
ncbi:hypothetical protein ACRAWF_38035 [Streptomyces sp. L7]